jgi:DNA ligase-1
MEEFVKLYYTLDASTQTAAKINALTAYFTQTPAEDAVWALALFSGRRLGRFVPPSKLRSWGIAVAQIPEWLFAECYDAVGDLGETLALLVAKNPITAPDADNLASQSLAYVIESVLLPLKKQTETVQQQIITTAWQQLSRPAVFIFNKLISGTFRVGVSHQTVVKALSKATQISEIVLADKLTGDWPITPQFFKSLFSAPTNQKSVIAYPFCLAYPLEEVPENENLGNPADWAIEWKWDGIRLQLIHRNNTIACWSRGEEMITERFPELHILAGLLPENTVLDGELLAWTYPNTRPLPFNELQQRITRKKITAQLLAKIPCRMLAFDILACEGQDLREQPFQVRRQLLEKICYDIAKPEILTPSTIFYENDWQQIIALRDRAPEFLAEGLMLKRLSSPYRSGRKRGDWWKWKVSPYIIDAVLVYAQRGTGRRAGLYTDYTFALWDEKGQLVPFAKAYSGLTDAEIVENDAFIRKHTLEKHGPVRIVEPLRVYEIAFEGGQPSNRHKSGVAVRFPRILRYRSDKKPADANTVTDLQNILKIKND